MKNQSHFVCISYIVHFDAREFAPKPFDSSHFELFNGFWIDFLAFMSRKIWWKQIDTSNGAKLLFKMRSPKFALYNALLIFNQNVFPSKKQ